jgi:UDP-N-acetylmuramoyl-tripeptide--D-alanyl-D-alanine ligase
MIPMSLGDIAAAIAGRVDAQDASARVTGSVEYDSGRVEPGGLFFAFRGERVDGHDFVASALERGAVAAVVAHPVSVRHIEVADPLRAMAGLATAVARTLTATVVGVTGSSGKSSTKDLLGAVLSGDGPTVAPAGSLNNDLGLPYTVLQADRATRYLVLEMGARGPGHIRRLTRIAPPQLGIVLNVGSAHLGEFGSRAAIAQAKGELVEALPSAAAGGLAILNADDPLVLAMAARTGAEVVTFGAATAGADVRAEDITLDELGRPGFVLTSAAGSASVQLRLVGAHQVSNALAVAAAALAVGIPISDVAERLGAASAVSPWRMELHERADGLLVVNDAYNANPESMRAALLALVAISRRRPGARSIAVLGTMAELGADGPAEHAAIGTLAAELGISSLIVVGDAARPIHDQARAAAAYGREPGESQWVPDAAAATSAVRAQARPGDVVLVKASRAASLEQVAVDIAEDEDTVRSPFDAAAPAARPGPARARDTNGGGAA